PFAVPSSMSTPLAAAASGEAGVAAELGMFEPHAAASAITPRATTPLKSLGRSDRNFIYSTSAFSNGGHELSPSIKSACYTPVTRDESCWKTRTIEGGHGDRIGIGCR